MSQADNQREILVPKISDIILLPCPFCNGDAKIEEGFDIDCESTTAAIFCEDCKATIGPQYPDNIQDVVKLIDQWNTRTNNNTSVVETTDAISDTPWFNGINWVDEQWTIEELKKAVEIQTALAWWFAHNDPGTPIPNWGYLFDPIDKAEILELWDDWNLERIPYER